MRPQLGPRLLFILGACVSMCLHVYERQREGEREIVPIKGALVVLRSEYTAREGVSYHC